MLHCHDTGPNSRPCHLPCALGNHFSLSLSSCPCKGGSAEALPHRCSLKLPSPSWASEAKGTGESSRDGTPGQGSHRKSVNRVGGGALMWQEDLWMLQARPGPGQGCCRHPERDKGGCREGSGSGEGRKARFGMQLGAPFPEFPEHMM